MIYWSVYLRIPEINKQRHDLFGKGAAGHTERTEIKNEENGSIGNRIAQKRREMK